MLRSLCLLPTSILLGSLLLATACSEDSPEPTPPDATPQCAGAPAFAAVDMSTTTLAAGDTFDISFSVNHFHFSGGDGHSTHGGGHEGGHGAGGHSAGGHSSGGHSSGGHSSGGHSADGGHGGHSAGGHSAGGHSEGGHMHGDGGHMHGDGGHMHGGNGMTAGADGCTMGHVHLYLDDLMTNPVAMITTPSATVQIAADVAPGSHQLIARLHDASHRIVEPQVVETIDITIE